MINKYYKY